MAEKRRSQGEGKKAFWPQWLSWLLDCFLRFPDLAHKVKQSEQELEDLILLIFHPGLRVGLEWEWRLSEKAQLHLPLKVRVNPPSMDMRDNWDVYIK